MFLLKAIPFLRGLNLDPSKWDKAGVTAALVTAQPAVVVRLDTDGMTVTGKGGNAAAEKQVVRSAIYLLVKGVIIDLFPQVPRQLAGHGADALRDRYARKIVPRLMKSIDATTTTEALVASAADAIIGQMF
ncbi:MAG: hypothetical protein H0U59_12120 [Gemmatimonadaceae bacterium]|nr:hypothetical protein [Gemmatimonadaceae bacterium]